MGLRVKSGSRLFRALALAGLATGLLANCIVAQAPKIATAATKRVEKPSRPKLVVLLVVDQMRGDYVDKFRGQWSGGLKRLLTDGAWFRNAAYPYAATETAPGHSTISTGAVPASPGMLADACWDRQQPKLPTCAIDR